MANNRDNTDNTGNAGSAENAVYAHQINVNVGGKGTRPVVTLWCMDCLVTVREFDQVNPWAEVQEAVDGHCAQPSRREELARVPSPVGGGVGE